MDRNGILSMLGLALRGSRLVVGEEPVEGVVRARDARVLFLASDAADNTCRRVKHFAEIGQCLWLRIPFTKDELGRAVGRSSVAIVAVTDIGMANAIVRRLAQLDPVKYDEAAAKLELKAQRAAERRAEQQAHIKNVRSGKYQAKKTDVKKAEPESPAPRKAEKPAPKKAAPAADGKPKRTSRPSKENRPKPRAKANPYAHSRPVQKGTGSFRRKAD